jgi:hypothetical protein
MALLPGAAVTGAPGLAEPSSSCRRLPEVLGQRACCMISTTVWMVISPFTAAYFSMQPAIYTGQQALAGLTIPERCLRLRISMRTGETSPFRSLTRRICRLGSEVGHKRGSGNWRRGRSANGCTASNCECELTRMHRRAEKAAPYLAGGQTKNAGWNLDSGLEIEHDPCWRVVARVFLPTRPSVNTAVHEPDRQIR